MSQEFQPACPLPFTHHANIQLAHGGGGKLMHDLIEKLFLPGFAGEHLASRHDGAVLDVGGRRLAFTTDSYVVAPLFFPGGDIGTLAVCGTVNDLAMCGARPAFLSAGFILEEGLPMETLWRVVRSMKAAADEAGVQFVTGDTKVVDRGKGDGLFVNTAGIGLVESDRVIGPAEVRPGDAVLLSGDIGRHGTAIMASREGLDFEGTIESDCAPLNGVVAALLESGVPVHCLRDLTRGGLASALVEIAEVAGVRIHLESASIPVADGVRGICEVLGLDPAYVANEGRMVVILPEAGANSALEVLRAHPVSAGAVHIGTVSDDHAGQVTYRSEIGATRVLDMLSGEQLPRIC